MTDISASTTTTADVVVVGGGPAGTAAAITLARAGRQVVVLDKARFPRDKCCGDGLTTGALRLLEDLELDPKTVPSWHVIEDITMRSPYGREVPLRLPATGGQFGAVARRFELDAALVNRARAAGAQVLEGHACTGVRQRGDRVVLDVEEQDAPTPAVHRIEARYVIAADGMWSTVRRLLGFAVPGYRGDWHAFRQYVTGVTDRARASLYVSFEADILPGYFWAFPVGEHDANIGFGIRRGGSFAVGAMKTYWQELLARPHIRELLGPDAAAEAPHKAWPIPANVNGMTPAAGRVFFVGDAVAATDPMSGEGIGQALATGRWAAEAVIHAGPHAPDRARSRYVDRVQTDLAPDNRWAEVFSRGLSHRKGAELAIAAADATDWTRRNFARWMFEDYPRGIVATPSRWRRGLLTGPGAYRR